MMELGPMTIGCLGVAALLVLCFLGIRFAFAGALVGTAGLTMMLGWDAGIRTAGIAPYTAGANYTLSVLPMFILIGYLAYYAGITQTAATSDSCSTSQSDASLTYTATPRSQNCEAVQ